MCQTQSLYVSLNILKDLRGCLGLLLKIMIYCLKIMIVNIFFNFARLTFIWIVVLSFIWFLKIIPINNFFGIFPQFITDVMKPMKIEEIMDQEVQNLSGGELQRVALVLCLGKPADVYLVDEPSAYLDSEQRLVAAKVIKRWDRS